jgi:nanoRNase/pAp phosphatase (c-di-AMP/oligoRNAs hydrolase)
MLDEAKVQRFRDVVTSINDDEDIYILITQVDPDAMGAAIALMYIVRMLTGNDRILIPYCGAISHRQNRAIVDMYNLDKWLIPIKQIGDTDFKEATVILVDSSSLNDNRIPEAYRPIDPVVVIDHHRGGVDKETNGHFVFNEDVGAVCTLIIELARALEIEIKDEQTNSLLALGIYTDTKQLIGASRRDRVAYGIVSEYVSDEAFRKLNKYPMGHSYFRHFHLALSSIMNQNGDKLVASIGHIPAEDGDDLALIADQLIRRAGTTFVLVFGIIFDKVRISVRSNDMTVGLDAKLKQWFGETQAGAKLTPDGVGEGGGLVDISLGPWLENGAGEDVEGEKTNEELKEEIVFRKLRYYVKQM